MMKLSSLQFLNSASRNFTLLFLSNLIKVIADNFASIAFVWLLLEAGGDAVSTSILYVCTIIPLLLLSLLVSPLLSRGRLTSWMFASDAARFVIVLAIPAVHLFHEVPIWLFFLSAFLQSTCGSIYSPASVALLPKIVESSGLQKANALIQSSNQVVRLIGLAGAGTLVTWLSAGTTLIITAFLFLFSAILVIFIRFAEEPTARPSYWKELREGFAVLRQHKAIYAMSMFFAFENIGVIPLFSLSAVFVEQDLAGNATTLTVLQGSQAIGAMVMGAILARVSIARQGALFMLASIVQGTAHLLLGFSPWLWLVILCSFFVGMAITAVNVPEMVIIQTTVPREQQAKVFAIVTTISTMFIPIASLAGGPLAKWLGAGFMISAGGLFALLTAIATLLFTPIAKLRVPEKCGKTIASE